MVTIVGKVKKARVFLLFVVKPRGSHSSKLIQSVCQWFHIVFFSIGQRRPLPYAKLSGTNLKIGTCLVKFSVKQSNGGDRAPLGVQGCGQRNSWLVESMKEWSRQQSLDMNFCDCQLEA